MSLYEVLGVAPDETPDVIRAAYHRAARRAHPDAGGSTEAFQQIEEAKRVLLDPVLRAHYDATGETTLPVDQAIPRSLQMLDALLAIFVNEDRIAKDHFVTWAIARIEEASGELTKVRDRETAKRRKLQNFLDRFKRKNPGDDEDLVASFITRQLKACDLALEECDTAGRANDRVRAIVCGYEYRADASGPGRRPGFKVGLNDPKLDLQSPHNQAEILE